MHTDKHTQTPPSNEEVFYNDICSLITNLLIDNKNYYNSVYKTNSYNCLYYSEEVKQLIRDTQSRARFILERLNNSKHLINL